MRQSTTQMRELAMQISRLKDQLANSGDQYLAITNALESVLINVDSVIADIERPDPPA